jgi:hypothetical protein
MGPRSRAFQPPAHQSSSTAAWGFPCSGLYIPAAGLIYQPGEGTIDAPIAKMASYLAAYQLSRRGYPMRSRSIDALWMSSAFCAALALAAIVMIALGGEQRGIHTALASTARLMFLLFWPAYCGAALVALLGPRFQQLTQHSREFGLAFSSALLVHLGLVGLLCLIGDAPGAPTFIFFGIGATLAYLLALFSFPRAHHLIGPQKTGGS